MSFDFILVAAKFCLLFAFSVDTVRPLAPYPAAGGERLTSARYSTDTVEAFVLAAAIGPG